ncbi:hypothetical protein KRX57_03495 [Weeksellaceae bacterium TAE3-ERU29]|nr:hypothetical protein [Weeksellaceae bacterium TAE3-ERU29]
MKKNFYTSLPVGICIYALANKKVNQTKLYIYLKSIASGHIKYTKTYYDYSKQWAKDLNCHPKTIKSGIDWLIRNKWITINNKSKSLRIVSYKQICNKYDVPYKSASIYESEYFDNFKAFCVSVAIVYFRNRKKWNDKRSAYNKRKTNASKSRYAFPKNFYPLPVLYLAKCLGVSKTTAHKYKLLAIEHGYIERKKQINTIYYGKEKLRKEELIAYASVLEEETSRRLRKGEIYLKIVDSDLIKSNIILKTKTVYRRKKVNGYKSTIREKEN